MKVKSGSANRPKYKIKYTMCKYHTRPYLVLTTLHRGLN